MAPSDDDSDQGDSAPDLEILGDQVTLHPSGYIEPLERQDDREGHALMHNSVRFRKNPLEFLREVSLHVSGTGWRAYENPIGQPIFYNGFSENMKAAVMATPNLLRKISELTEKRLVVEEKMGLLNRADRMYASKKALRRNILEESITQVAEKMTDQMICKMESKTFIRGAYYMCTQLLTRAYNQGVHMSTDDILMLKEVAKEAEKKRHSIIFLPCHRSHVDYVSLQLVCYRLGIGLPTVVAGDNLNIPVLGSFLQHAGAMWIRRSFGDDALYTTLVQSYIDCLLQGGFNFECFVEGGRSRTGKLLPPKFGILGFIFDSIISGRVEDTIICPVSTQYDKVIETEGYVDELLGVPKKKENLADFLSASSVLSLKLGRVDIRLQKPWSLRQFIQEQQTRFTSGPKQMSMSTIAGNPELRLRILRTMGYKILTDINAVSVVMPTALIGTVLLTLRGRGVGKDELVRRVEWLSARIHAKGGRVAKFKGIETAEIVDRGLEVLGKDLVGVIDDLHEMTYYAVDRFQLSFYRNMTIHLFISEALVSAALYSKIKTGGGKANVMDFEDLRDQVLFLSSLFRGEFIYPTEGLAVNLENTLRGLETDKIMELVRDSAGNITKVGLADEERSAGRENYDFYCFLIWPFIEASWLAAVSLMGLTPPLGKRDDIMLDWSKTQNSAQLLGKTLYHQGDLSYFEAVNKETLKNAYTRFEEEGIIRVSRSRVAKSSPKLRLSPEWTPSRDPATEAIEPRGRLWDFAEKIALSRREGKNRRDGATVERRVLRLVEVGGRGLFEEAEREAAKVAASSSSSSKDGKGEQVKEEEEREKKRRRRGAKL